MENIYLHCEKIWLKEENSDCKLSWTYKDEAIIDSDS